MNLEIYLQEIMRNVAASLMMPVMIALVLLILFAVYSVGSIVAEFFIERRHFKANMPRDINAVKDASIEELDEVIESTGLLRRQKEALKTIAANLTLPEDDLFALAKSEVSATDARYRRKVGRTDLVTKIAPMMGLMCTLIPLGPGIVAMGQGEVNVLSNSLLVAFDGTVAGLIGGVVSMCVSAVRKRWYASYLLATESLATSVLQKADEAREQAASAGVVGATAPDSFGPSSAGAQPYALDARYQGAAYSRATASQQAAGFGYAGQPLATQMSSAALGAGASQVAAQQAQPFGQATSHQPAAQAFGQAAQQASPPSAQPLVQPIPAWPDAASFDAGAWR